MKKFKKLIPALCMLLISAVLVGTSTYAWFSMNPNVSATGMTINAKSDSTFLVINAGSSFKADNTEMSATSQVTGTTSLYPVTPKTTLTTANVTTASSWQYGYVYPGSTGTQYTTCTDLTNYVASEDFFIGLNTNSGVNESAKTIYLESVTLAANTGISCVVVCDGGNVVTVKSTDTFAAADLGVKATKDGVKVTVYYFINGEDSNVVSSKLTSLTGKVTLNFTIDHNDTPGA